MSTPEQIVPVEQVDRDAAAAIYSKRGNPVSAGACRRGERDSDFIVQAFARHRLAALSPAQGVRAALVRAQAHIAAMVHPDKRDGITRKLLSDISAVLSTPPAGDLVSREGSK